MKTTAKLTIETKRVLVIRSRAAKRRAICEACGEVVGLVTADEAAALTQASSRAIYRLIEARKLHFNETAGQSLLICLNSLCQSSLDIDASRLVNKMNWEG